MNDVRVEVLNPSRSPIATIIWLHGKGQGPDVLMEVARRFDLPDAGVRGVFPAAPERMVGRVRSDPVTAWFEQSVFAIHNFDLLGALAMEAQLRSLVAEEIERAGPNRVLLAGFSQGAVASLMLGLRYTRRISGMMLYASYMPDQLESLLAVTRTLPTDVPIWLGHGARDWIVPSRAGRRVRDTLVEWGYPVTWYRYQGGHEPFEAARNNLHFFLNNTVGLKLHSPDQKESS